jgi:hypothetical protein
MKNLSLVVLAAAVFAQAGCARPGSAQEVTQTTTVSQAQPQSRRQLISERLPQPDLSRWAADGGFYSPAPAEPQGWMEADVPGRNYSADVRAAFDADPLLVGQLCWRADRVNGARLNARWQNLHSQFQDVCRAFPDDKLEAAYIQLRARDGRTWLNGLWNRYLDEAAALSPDARIEKADALLQPPPTSFAGFERFEHALRGLAYSPGDPRGIAYVLLTSSDIGNVYPNGAPPSIVAGWLSEQIQSRRKNSIEWMRASRNMLAAMGGTDAAIGEAKQIVASANDAMAPRDKIILAALQRAAGDSAAYETLMRQCPAPDAFYVRANGTPVRPEQYCDDVVSTFARAMRGETFAAMRSETIRQQPAMQQATNNASAQDAFDAEFNSLVDRVTARTAALRTQEPNEGCIDESEGRGCSVTMEMAIAEQVRRPWHELGAVALIRAAHERGRSSDLDFDKRALMLVHRWLERRAASGADAAEWQRGLRAFEQFTGEYDKALALDRAIAAHPDAKMATRDAIARGIDERLHGNRKPLDEAITHCVAETSPDEPAMSDSKDYCREMVMWNIHRARLATNANIDWIQQERKLPVVYADILEEIAKASSDMEVVLSSAMELTEYDALRAAPIWRDLISKGKLKGGYLTEAYGHLAKVAAMEKDPKAGMAWVDRYLASFATPDFSSRRWRDLAGAGPGAAYGVRGSLAPMLDERFRFAMQLSDYDQARTTIEMQLANSTLADGDILTIRRELIELATREAQSGKRAEALRIAGYLKGHRLDAERAAALADLAKKLGDVKPAATPWDSLERTSPVRPPRTAQST